ncbi:MAG: TldD/PmbA family protein, partial [Deltaproteobacteria bacterium]|nr:TldD/PmbA family protein [Deltaproteobacteria bacterium]
MKRLELSQDLARDIVLRARTRGATAADVVMVESENFFVTVRLGEVEKISQAQEKRVGLRLFFGSSSATASTSDVSTDAIERLVEDTCALARVTARDEYSGLPEPECLARKWPDLDLLDETAHSLSVEERTRMAILAEETALGADPKVVNSEGAEFSNDFHRVVYASSHDFFGEYRGSAFNLSVSPVAAQNGSMQRDYWYSSQRKFSSLQSPEAVGKEAARRALRRLGARKVKTREVPVVFDPETAASLLRHLASAISGYSLYKGASFLTGKLGSRIASEPFTVIDDGMIPAALGSKPFDGEGLPTTKKIIVERGILDSYL